MKVASGSIVAVGGVDIFFGPHIDDAKSHLGGTQWWQSVQQRWLRGQGTNLSGFVRACHARHIHDNFLLFEQHIVSCFERGESATIDGSFLDLSTLHPQQIVP